MFTKKLLLALLVAPTLLSAEPLKLPTSITIPGGFEGDVTIKNLTWLNATLQLLYSLPEVKESIKMTASQDEFTLATANFLKDPTNKDLYKKVYEAAPKSPTFDVVYAEPKNLVETLITNGLTEQQKDLFSFQLDKRKLTSLFIDYTTLQSILNGEGISDQSKYLLITVSSLYVTDSSKATFPIDIFTCKNNELIGFIILEYTKDVSQPPFTVWKNDYKYKAYTKDPVGDKWYMETFPIVSSIDLIKNMPLELNPKNMQEIINQKFNPAYLAYHFPVVLIYKKIEKPADKPSEITTEDTNTFPDFVKALDQI